MKSLVVCGGLALSLMSASCAVETSDGDYVDHYPPTHGPGVVPSGSDDAEFSVEWTIDGGHESGLCRSVGADYAHVEIEDDVGVIDEADIDCEEFAYDAPPLPPGSYWATVVLRDAGDRDLTTAARTDARDLFPGDSDYVSVDFPQESFR